MHLKKNGRSSKNGTYERKDATSMVMVASGPKLVLTKLQHQSGNYRYQWYMFFWLMVYVMLVLVSGDNH
jgi:hypothetical protein